VTDKQYKIQYTHSEQQHIHVRWSIFTFPGQNEPHPGHGTLCVNSGTIPAISGRLASLSEGHQHLAGGHGGGCEQMSPIPPRGSRGRDARIFWYIFNTKSCIMMHSLAPKMDNIRVFIKNLCIGGNEDCWKRLLNEAQRAENRGQRPRSGWGS